MTRFLGSVPAQRWTPAEFASSVLALWLDADDDTTFTLSGSNVSQWNDKSGNARNATQGTDANRPTRQTNVLNGGACVRFDGSSDRMTTGHSFNGYTSFAVYAVMKADTDNGSQSMVRQQPDTNPNYFVFPWTQAGTVSPRVIVSWDGQTTSTNLTGSLTSACVLGFVRVSGSTNKARRNGTEESSRTANSSSATPTGNTQLGWSQANNGEFFDGDLHELVIYQGSLSDTDRDRIEGYLAWKWGLVSNLPTGHTYKNQAP